MARLATNKNWEFGTVRTTGFGDLIFDENGLSQEISSNDAKTLVAISKSLSIYDEGTEETTTVNEGDTPLNDEENPETEASEGEKVNENNVDSPPSDPSAESNDDLRKEIESMSANDIKTLLAEAEIDEKSYKYLAKKELVELALKNL